MKLLLSEYDLIEISRRAEAWLIHGDREAFRPEDCAALLSEVQTLRTLRERLAVLNAEYLKRLNDPAQWYGGPATPNTPNGAANPPEPGPRM